MRDFVDKYGCTLLLSATFIFTYIIGIWKGSTNRCFALSPFRSEDSLIYIDCAMKFETNQCLDLP